METQGNNENKNYCLISKEILLFIEWVLLHDMKFLEGFIKKVWKNGFQDIYMEDLDKQIKLNELDGQQTILDFFSVLDSILNKLNEKQHEEKYQKINKILSSDLSIYLNQSQSCEDALGKSFPDLLKKDSFNKDMGKEITSSNECEKDIIRKNFYKNFLKKWNPSDIIIE